MNQEYQSQQNFSPQKYQEQQLATAPSMMNTGLFGGAPQSTLDETEQEAIELIQSQVLQINMLKDQLTQKEETIDNLRIQNKQIEAYKQQIQNLKQQIVLFEERFKYYEEDRQHYEKRLQSQSMEGDNKNQHMLREIEELQRYLQDYRRQKEEDVQVMAQLQNQVEQKERLYVCIKEQVESLGKQLETLQFSMHEREEASTTKISGLKKDLKLGFKEKKLLEQRIRELTEIVQAKQQDTLNQSKIVTDKDQLIKKLKEDILKLKREKDDVNSKRLQLEQRMPSLEQNLLDLNRIVEKCQLQIDKEAIKRENLLQENNQLRLSLQHFQEIYQDLNITDPLQFKQEIDKTRDEIGELKTEMLEKQRYLKSKEELIGMKEAESKEQRIALQKEIKGIYQWIQKHITAKSISAQDELSEEDDEEENDNKINKQALDQSTTTFIDPIIVKEFQKLRSLLINQKTQVQQKFLKQQQRIDSMQHELQDAQKIKQEILEDFKRLKSQIKQSEVVSSQNDEYKTELHRVIDHNNQLKEQIQQIEQELQKFTIETYNVLYNIRHKFENNQRINSQLDMSLRYQYTTEKYASIMELATMIGDITNILNFELKNLELKDSQYQELYDQLQEVKTQSDRDLRRNEELRVQELSEIQQNFEKKYLRFKEYQLDIEKINIELQAQMDSIRQENVQKEKQINIQQTQIEQQESIMQNYNELEQKVMPNLLLRIDELIFQKKVCMRELKLVQQQYGNTQKAQKYMCHKVEQQIVGEDALKEHLQRTGSFGGILNQNVKQNNRYKEDNQNTIYSPDSQKRLRKIHRELAFPTQCLKLRKYVIAILFSLRMKKSKHSQKLSLQNEDLLQIIQSETYQPSEQLQQILSYMQNSPAKQVSMLSYLSIGLKSLRQQIQTHNNHYASSDSNISAQSVQTFSNLDYSSLSFDMQYLFNTFKPKEYYNRHLLKLENLVERQKAAALLVSQQAQQYETENKKLNDKVFSIQQELVQSYQTCEKYGLQVQELERELQQCVSMDEFSHLRENYDQIGKDFYDTKDNFRRVNDKMERLVREKDELQDERRQLLQQIIEQEQNVQEKIRDLELKDVKIQSLESILQKRDMSLDFSSTNINKYEDKIRKLEADRENLIKDNITLIKENEYLKEQINITMRDEQEKFRVYNEEKSQKQEEIQRLLETNLQTLEDRCQLLEQQIEQLRRDKQELINKNSKLMMLEQSKENTNLLNFNKQYQNTDTINDPLNNPNILYQTTLRSPTFQNLHQEQNPNHYQNQNHNNSSQFNFDFLNSNVLNNSSSQHTNLVSSTGTVAGGNQIGQSSQKYQTLQSTNSLINLGLSSGLNNKNLGHLGNQTSHFKSIGSDSGHQFSGTQLIANAQRESPNSKIPGKISKTKSNNYI
eukprot:403355403